MLDGRDFALDGGPAGEGSSRFTRDLPEQWCFDGRAFGGYTSALALATVFAHSELDVRSIRAVRTTAAVEATIRPRGRTILIASSWFADGWLGPPSVDAPVPFERYGTPATALPDPQSAPALDWIGGEYPPMRFARRRGVDYPASLTRFA